MNFSVWQWRVIVVLDVLIKSSCPAFGRKHFALGVTLLALLLCPSFCRAQQSSLLAQSTGVPTFEALPHATLPPGKFKTWCGRTDRYFLVVDGWLAAYDGNRKVSSSTLSIAPRMPVRCSEDGRQAFYVDDEARQVKKVNIEVGASQVLATYKPDQSRRATVSFSPDLQSVATDRSLQLTDEAGKLKVIPVNISGKANLRDIRWNDGSSKLFIAYLTTIEVIDAKGGRIGSGALPKGTYFRDGWFDAGDQVLVLYLALDRDESGPGRLIKCRIVDWKCDRLRSRVDQVSFGGRGAMGIVSPVGRAPAPSHDDDAGTITYADRYSVELRDHASNLLVRQIFLTAIGHTGFKVNVAPSGTKAILRWDAELAAQCRRHEVGDSYCEQGMIVDLSRVLK